MNDHELAFYLEEDAKDGLGSFSDQQGNFEHNIVK